MAFANNTETLQNRRYSQPDKATLMSRLTMSQKFAVHNLDHYGYNLVFMRNSGTKCVAVMANGNNLATIDVNGNIDTSPNIAVRQA